MDVQVAYNLLVAVSAALAAGLSIWNFFQAPSKKNAEAIGDVRKDIKELDGKVDEVSSRVSTLETVIEQMPDKDAMHRLELGLERMHGELQTLSERLRPIDNLSRRLQELLIERAK